MQKEQTQTADTIYLEEYCTIRFKNPMVYDRLHILSAEYAIPVESLVNKAAERLLDDVEFMRRLRMGNMC